MFSTSNEGTNMSVRLPNRTPYNTAYGEDGVVGWIHTHPPGMGASFSVGDGNVTAREKVPGYVVTSFGSVLQLAPDIPPYGTRAQRHDTLPRQFNRYVSITFLDIYFR